MRSDVTQYEMVAPKSLDEVLANLSSEPGKWTLFAGGTDLMVLMESGKLAPKNFLSLWGVKELKGISYTDDSMTFGALTTYGELQRHSKVREYFPMLIQAAKETGGLAIQNRGTLGGNIANASPAADSPPGLLVYDAELELTSVDGSRWVPYDGFHTGYKQMKLGEAELITKIRVPRPDPKGVHYFKKVGTRRAQAISKIVLAGFGLMNEGAVKTVRIAVGSVAAITLRCHKTEAFLTGKSLNDSVIAEASEIFGGEITPIDDVRSTGRYRRQVGKNLLKDFLESL
ncbi:MAG: xanthine dehydrogenase family protein subunit M [Planctomycetota bacterium]|nr:xanthine dehydrogenase family protein subunit M [Planctomycetota bacterium]